MKVLIDLLEAYAEHVDLPLLLVNIDENINYKFCEDDFFYSFYDSNELKHASCKQSKPAIWSVTSDFPSNLFYIITPVFLFKNIRFFIVAGPCLLKTEEFIENQNSLALLNDEELEDRLNKIRNLYFYWQIKKVLKQSKKCQKKSLRCFKKYKFPMITLIILKIAMFIFIKI